MQSCLLACHRKVFTVTGDVVGDEFVHRQKMRIRCSLAATNTNEDTRECRTPLTVKRDIGGKIYESVDLDHL